MKLCGCVDSIPFGDDDDGYDSGVGNGEKCELFFAFGSFCCVNDLIYARK